MAARACVYVCVCVCLCVGRALEAWIELLKHPTVNRSLLTAAQKLLQDMRASGLKTAASAPAAAVAVEPAVQVSPNPPLNDEALSCPAWVLSEPASVRGPRVCHLSLFVCQKASAKGCALTDRGK
jgi:hypothetical protein